MGLLEVESPRALGFDERQLERVDRLLAEWTSGVNPIWPAASLAVGRRGKLLAPRVLGRQGPEADAPPVRRDGVFLIASLTKPITYLAGLMLVERGLLTLSEPVARYIPEFAAHHKETTLVQHLFTHTSGLPDMLENNIELRRQHAPLSKFVEHVIRDTVPLFPPGAGFSYQSMGTLMVAELVQRLSGLTIAEFLRRELFEPLELHSTRLGATGIDPARLVRLRTPPTQEPEWNWNSRYWRELGAPWGGMFTTAAEYGVLCQLMLNGGEIAGRRYLSPATVKMATSNRLDDLPDVPESARRTKAWGLGWQMNHPAGIDSLCDLLDARAYGHIGATGTMVWIHPPTESFCVLFTTAPRDDAPWRLVAVCNAVAAALLR